MEMNKNIDLIESNHQISIDLIEENSILKDGSEINFTDL